MVAAVAQGAVIGADRADALPDAASHADLLFDARLDFQNQVAVGFGAHHVGPGHQRAVRLAQRVVFPRKLLHRRLIGGGVGRLADALEGFSFRPHKQPGQVAPQLLHVEDRVPLAGEALQIGVVQLVVEGPEGLLVRSGAAPGLAHQGGVGQQALADHHLVHAGEVPGEAGAVSGGHQAAVEAQGALVVVQGVAEPLRAHRALVEVGAHPGVEDEQGDRVFCKNLQQAGELLRVLHPQPGFQGDFHGGSLGKDRI